MKPELQRKAIAEACGWTFVHLEGYGGCDLIEAVEACNIWRNPAGLFTRDCFPPDYLNDLNACHDMESCAIYSKGRVSVEVLRFESHLRELTDYYPAHATAAQRCEAFLRTLNLYKP